MLKEISNKKPSKLFNGITIHYRSGNEEAYSGPKCPNITVEWSGKEGHCHFHISSNGNILKSCVNDNRPLPDEELLTRLRKMVMANL